MSGERGPDRPTSHDDLVDGTPPADLTSHVARFARRLRQRGIDAGPADQRDALAALQLVDIADVEDVFLALRTAMKVERRAWPEFALLFERMWRRADSTDFPVGVDAHDRRAEQGPFEVHRVAGEKERGDASPIPKADRSTGYSAEARLRKKSFDECTDEDLATMQRLLERVARRLATRHSRRRVPSARGDLVDLRRSLRRALAGGGDILDLARRSRARQAPSLVLLCDTSGSMDAHSRFLLAFALALKRVAPRTETFAFNTHLTRLTPWLAPSNVVATLDRLARGVADWSGGTRIGACLLQFSDAWLHQTVHADTTVIILSDGLDRGDTDMLEEALVRIRRRARRVVWLNPLMGDARYRPEAKGMKAALPHIDALVPAHDLAALEAMLPLLA